MKIIIVTPAPSGSLKGNRVSALRWARIFRKLGHRVDLSQEYRGERCDLLVALHARRSFDSLKRFRQLHPELPLILVLTGTDLYRDIKKSASAHKSLELASRLVVLQPMGIKELPRRFQTKTTAIIQSAKKTRARVSLTKNAFSICVIGHLRPVKDPFRAAMATRGLPDSSRIRVLHLGAALRENMEKQARRESISNHRYRWLGSLPAWRTRKILASSHLMVLSSVMEGGANVISEALAAGVPVLASRISGSVGILGEKYPGYFPVKDTDALKKLLIRAESDVKFHQGLRRWCRRLSPLVHPDHELREWRRLLREDFGRNRE